MRPTMLRSVLAVCLIISAVSFASDVVEVIPLKSDILVVHLDDGHVDYHQKGEPRNADVLVVDPVDSVTCNAPGTYSITSPDDPNYSSAKSPTSLGRKSKAMEFAMGAPLGSDFAREHWVYLQLPTPMQPGKTYVLNTGSLAKNGSQWTMKFDAATARSEAIHVNILGYSTLAPEKYAYIYHWGGDLGSIDFSAYEGQQFQLVNTATGSVAYTGTINWRQAKDFHETAWDADTRNQNFLEADVWDCDFSAFNTPGTYVVAVEGIGCSFPFDITPDAYRQAWHHVTRALFYNRAGQEITAEYSDHPRPADHHPDLTPGFSGKIDYSSTRTLDAKDEGNDAAWEANIKGPINTWGWYHDAGDWDGYRSHHQIPVFLLFTYEFYSQNFSDGDLNIPESGNGMPDILDEAAWLMRFFHRTRHAIVDAGYGNGGAGGARVFAYDKIGDNPDTYASWEDVNRQWLVSGEDPSTSYLYAGMAAQMAFNLKKLNITDPKGVDWEQEAKEVYQWAENNQQPTDSLARYRNYAAAALYRLTQQSTYHDDFIEDWNTMPADNKKAGSFTNSREWRYGPWLYANLPQHSVAVDQTTYDACHQSIKETAEFIMTSSFIKDRACRWSGNFWRPLNTGAATSPQIIDGVFGYGILKHTEPDIANQILARMYTTADYFLGTNPLNMCWINGLGERHPTQFLHLDWWYCGNAEIIPGFVPYGPYHVNSDFNYYAGYSHLPAFASIYPQPKMDFPAHERFFNARYHIATGEFTVHQTIIHSSLAYGALCAPAGMAPIDNSRPVANAPVAAAPRVAIAQLRDGAVEVRMAGEQRYPVTVRITDLTGRLITWAGIDGTRRRSVVLRPEVGCGTYVVSVSGSGMRSASRVVMDR